MKQITLSIFVFLFLVACDKGEPTSITCDEATLCVRNPSPNHYVLFEWADLQTPDTIFPGECATRTARDIFINYDRDGNVTDSRTKEFYFNTDDGRHVYTLDRCSMEVEATSGFWNPKRLCSNGIFNPEMGEKDTDCGGYCEECPPRDFSCAPDEQTFGFTHVNNRDSQTNVEAGVDVSGDYEVTFEFGFDRELTATFHIPSLPNHSRKFITGDDEHEVTLFLNMYLDDRYAVENQEVFLVKDSDSKYRLVFCDITFPDSFGGSWNASANFEL